MRAREIQSLISNLPTYISHSFKSSSNYYYIVIMKHFIFILLAIGFATVCAHPHQKPLPPPNCMLPRYFERIKRFNFDQDGKPIDIFLIKESSTNQSLTLNDDTIKGTFIINGVQRTTHPFLSYNYDTIHKKLYFITSVKEISLTGFYEIVDGHVNEPTLGNHSFSGKGILNVSKIDVVDTIEMGISVDPHSQQLSLAELKFSWKFGNASVVAENLVVDDFPVEWEMVMENIGPLYQKIRRAIRNYRGTLREVFVAVLQGCKLSDLTPPEMPYTQHPEQEQKISK